MPDSEEIVPKEEMLPPDSSKRELPSGAKGPVKHQVSKISVSNKGAKVVKPATEEAPPTVKDEPTMKKLPTDPQAMREVARKARAERDKKIYQAPMDRRRDQFNNWKERNLPWTKSKKEEGEASPEKK